MKITDVTLSIPRTELAETVIPTRGAVDAMPPLVLVSVATAEGIDGNSRVVGENNDNQPDEGHDRPTGRGEFRWAAA
jgi:hypothetical protein